MKMVELLAPAGGFDELVAAIIANADSVYVGAKAFSARAFAKNFSYDELKKAIDFCHLRGKKIYLAINTLIREREIEDALNCVNFAYKEGIDGLIVQDLGLLLLIRSNFPDVNIHASTQMCIHNSLSFNVLKEFGVKRVVLARELSFDEIKNIRKNTDVQIEVFVHGALCISYSGQCLFSSMIFKRSGNKGQCAQPCRLYYEMLSKNKRKVDEGYLLSPRDISLINSIADLISLGVDAFKIEGRLKDKYYVYVVTSIFRKYIDMYYEKGFIKVDEEDEKKLFLVFNRGNLSSGYLYDDDINRIINKYAPNNTGLFLGSFLSSDKGVFIDCKKELSNGDVISFRVPNKDEVLFEINNNTEKRSSDKFFAKLDSKRYEILKRYKKGDVFIVKSKRLCNEVDKYLNDNRAFRKISFFVKIKKGKNIIAFAKTDGYSTEITGPMPDVAKTRPITYNDVYNAFSKLNHTVFELEKIEAEIDDDVYVKVSVLNSLRKSCIDDLTSKILKDFKREDKKDIKCFEILPRPKEDKHFIKRYSFLVENYSQYEFIKKRVEEYKLKQYDIYVPYNLVFKKMFSNDDIVYFDRITHDSEIEKIDIDALKELHFTKVLIRNFGQYYLFKDHFELYFDYSFNILNSFSIYALKDLKAKRVCLSVEISKDDIASLQSEVQLEMPIYFKVPLMINRLRLYEHGAYLKDRNGNLLPLRRTNEGRNEIINPLPFFIKDDIDIDVLRFDFTNCSIKEMDDVVSSYFKNNEIKFRYTKGYFGYE